MKYKMKFLVLRAWDDNKKNIYIGGKCTGRERERERDRDVSEKWLLTFCCNQHWCMKNAKNEDTLVSRSIFRMNTQKCHHFSFKSTTQWTQFVIGFHCLFRFYKVSMLESMNMLQLISKNQIYFSPLFSLIANVFEMRQRKAHLWSQKFKFTYTF